MRIVSLAPSNTEILCKLGLEEYIVATTSLCDYPEKAVEKPSVGGWTNTDTEKVEKLEPDLALASDDLQDEVVAELEEKGIEVRQFKPHTLQEVFESIREIGRLVDREETAEEITDQMKTGISSIDLEGRRIYCEEWMDPPMVSGNWIPGLIERSDGEYFIDEGERSREFKFKKLKQFDPEYIFLNVCGAGKNIDTAEVKNRENWNGITAVEKDNIYVVDDAFLNRPGPRLVEGLKEIQSKIENV